VAAEAEVEAEEVASSGLPLWERGRVEDTELTGGMAASTTVRKRTCPVWPWGTPTINNTRARAVTHSHSVTTWAGACAAFGLSG